MSTQTTQPLQLSDGAAAHVLAGIETVLVDMDGVLWEGPNAIPGAAHALAELARSGKRLVFVTNNSSKSRATFSAKLRRLLGPEAGPAVTDVQFAPDHVFTSGVAAAHVVGPGTKAYVIGEAGLFAELRAGGVFPIGEGDSSCVLDLQSGQAPVAVDPEISAVVVGFDGFINYYKLAYACRCLRENPNCRLIACNTDAAIPSAGGVLMPGSGCMVQAVSCAAGVQPHVVCGKPQATLFSIVSAAFGGLDPAKTLMVGDNVDTDIAFGRACGLRTLLVLSGYTTRKAAEELSAQHPDAAPDYVASSFGSLFDSSHPLMD